MPKLISQCPTCKKTGVLEKNSFKLGKTKFITLSCGHCYSEDLTKISDSDDLFLHDNRKLYPFQVEGHKFLERSNFRALIADEMGLGKTIQVVSIIHSHYDELVPILIVVKASLTYNWFREIYLGTGRMPQVYKPGIPIIPGIKMLIVSYDTLTPREKTIGKDSFGDKLKKLDTTNIDIIKAFNPKTIILDECQMIKNHDAGRTNAVREVVRDIKTEEITFVDPVKYDQRQKYYFDLANELLKKFNLDKRFELKFKNQKSELLGLTRCKVTGEGLITGEVIISKHLIADREDSEIVDVIKHEIAHAITPGAGHNQIWKDTAKSIGATGQVTYPCNGSIDITKVTEKIRKNLIALSGTPIKNNALEYFPILNLLTPNLFPSMRYFEDNYVDYYGWGNSVRAGGLRNPELFKTLTKDFIIRRLRDEVLPDLPKIQRDYKYYELSNEVRKAYGKRVKDLEKFMDETEDTGFEYYTNLLAHLAKLRHITGIAKVEPVLEYGLDYLDQMNGSSKLVIFHHHIDVGDLLEIKLKESDHKIIRMTSADDSQTRLDKIDKFRDHGNIFLIPTLAGGEGLNLQFCNHAVLMEREWNPANEEQAEGRFSRIGSEYSSVQVVYPVATGTIDEYFAELVEIKRSNVKSSLDGVNIDYNESDIMRELAEIVVKKWKM